MNKNKKKKKKNGLWFSSFASTESFSRISAEKMVKSLDNIIFYAITIPIQLVQTVGVFIIAYFNNSFTELSFFLLGFYFTRYFLGETFHFFSPWICTIVTWALFYLITAFIPSIYISIFLNLILGCSLSIYMNYIATRSDD